MDDPRARRGVPDRLLLPPAPDDPVQAARWRALPFPERRRIARAVTGAVTATADEAPLVAALAARRLRTGWRLYAAAAVLAWLVLMTVWGFGRSTAPDDAGPWLVAGLTAGPLAGAFAAAMARRHLARVRSGAGGPTDHGGPASPT